ncbi:hypothetical protein A3J17_01260 [Candidatus Curtissbacteria bacterium RIFCSPLOWO2_02_FULL_40_11]|uniref:Ribonuclease VapC n=2 Tax=Candidatus Curtissiibacteriota TaxID=1752717 RepID=A0A1F5GBA7_9BACT|nr:MAG: hypothetical protein A3D04_03510 [Candidatus Curtissbacteria bacterium RIFCSPHIGHO2_02_FULL_40_16b]OGE00851.1 MAG: hypothetical protein A3J17_01260 [Candidatus Curtissbacteria bacterium RIFCSPLOWO2_02_FULL_40_11]OGE14039.1 MAG: hypothetical protein A3G14_03415 [Candidatus Curtissbacteria bacterium RIFCSPLOWO2_12_FULL_38_9]
MPKKLLDANIIIRFLVSDDPNKANRVEKLLAGQNNKNILVDIVVAEIIWVLGSYYQFDKSSIIESLKALIHYKSIVCNKTLLESALTLWEKYNISFIDAYLISVAKLKSLNIYSYDVKFDKVDGVKRQEP